MAVTEFLNNFRVASQFVPPRTDVGETPPTPEQLEEARKYASIWLTPRSVEGFDRQGFHGLSDEQKLELAELVEQFRALSSDVAAGGGATDDQVAEGRRLVVAIRRLVGRYLYDLPTQSAIRAVERVWGQNWFPDFVVSFDIELGDDATGDPAVWVWFIVTDEAAEEGRVFGTLRALRQAVYDQLTAAGIPPRLVYIQFRTIREHQDLLAGVAE